MDNILQVVGFINNDYVVDIFYYHNNKKFSFRENRSIYHIDSHYECLNKEQIIETNI